MTKENPQHQCFSDGDFFFLVIWMGYSGKMLKAV